MFELDFSRAQIPAQDAAGQRLPTLLTQYRAGDQDAFRRLHHLCHSSVVRWLKQKLRHPRYRADFHDALQVSMFFLSRCSDSFVTDRQVIKWLGKTARNTALNFHRRRRPSANSELAYLVAERVSYGSKLHGS